MDKSKQESLANQKDQKTQESQQKQKGQEDQENQESQKSQKSPLKQSMVATGNNKLQKIGILIALIVVVAMIFMAFKDGHEEKDKQAMAHGFANQHDEVVAQNTAQLHALENMKRQKQTVEALITNHNSESKEQTARRHAPSQVYAGGISKSQRNRSNAEINNDTILSDKDDAYATFANSQNNTVSTVSATQLKNLDKMIAQGELMHAVLETAINSDLPGMVRAIVSTPVYSYQSGHVLIPKGSRLIGQYASLAGNGAATTRIYMMWNRVITPEGVSIMINSPSTDGLGESGQGADNVDTHFWRIFGGSALLSIIGAGTANLGVSSTDQPNSSDAYQQAVAQSFQMAAGNSLQRNMSIKPTISIDQGALINVFVAKDLDFTGVNA